MQVHNTAAWFKMAARSRVEGERQFGFGFDVRRNAKQGVSFPSVKTALVTKLELSWYSRNGELFRALRGFPVEPFRPGLSRPAAGLASSSHSSAATRANITDENAQKKK